MTNISKEPIVAVTRFTDKVSALDSQNHYYDIIKQGDGRWIGGEPSYINRQKMFNKEADRALKYAMFNGIMFHGYTFSATCKNKRKFDDACFRMHEYLTGLYVTPGMDGRCLGAFTSHRAGRGDTSELENCFSVVFSACQIEDRISWLTVMHEPAYFEEFLVMLKEKWVELVAEIEA
tara:strand:+ start:2299 stop:2829 length:531 start_codon:yes stop_codon:yes gene_type:complete